MGLLSVLLVSVSVAAIALFAIVAGLRVPYPFELEWMEGGMLHHVQRAIDGEPLFAPPSLEYLAYPYTPLYAYVAAGLAVLVGSSFWLLRLVSIASALVAFGLVARIVKRDTGNGRAGLIGAGLLAAAYEFTGCWYDIARVDSLALALTLAGVALAQRRPVGPDASVRSFPAASGFLLFLACFTKQSALGPAVGVGLVLLLRDRRQALRFFLSFTLPLVGFSLWLNAASEGWFRWHVYDLLRSHPLYRPHILGYWEELLANLGPALILPLWVNLAARRVPNRLRWDPLLVTVCLFLLASSWIGRMHTGGFDNTLIQAAAAAAMLFGLALARVPERPSNRRVLVLVAGLLQFALLAYDPRPKLPTDADRAAGEAIVQELASIEGDVWMPYHGYLAERAGGQPGAHAMPIIDLLQGGDVETAQAFVTELERAIASGRWRWIVLDDLSWEEQLPSLAAGYRRTRSLFSADDPGLFLPRTGEPQRPLHVYERR